MILKGDAVSKGIAIGRLYLYLPETMRARAEKSELEAHDELAIYAGALEKAKEQLDRLYEKLSEDSPENAAIFEAHADILEDEDICAEIKEAIMLGKTAVWAIEEVYNRYALILGQAQDELLAQRANDLVDVQQRLLRAVYGVGEQDLSCLPEPVIIVARELLPSDTAGMDAKNVLGIVTERGGATSHSAIIARGMGILAVLGVENAVLTVGDGEYAVLDALSGTLETQPDASAIAAAEKKLAAFKEEERISAKYLDKPCLTADGTKIDIGLNVGGGNDRCETYSNYTDFVGLLRTEFIYMDSDHMPTEEEQFEAYKKVVAQFAPRPVTLRTLDIGGDKTLPYFELPREDNPFLGVRALRLCFAHEDIFRTQLRAAIRASAYGTLWLMFPMVSGVEDFIKAKHIFNEEYSKLSQAGVAVGEIKLGVMIETPSMAFMADKIAELADFGSIGSNDLCQYLTAADRMNSAVAEYCPATHPALYRAIAATVKAFNREGKHICVCGELGGDEFAARVLVGLGMRSLSMSADGVARVKRALSKTSVEQMRQLAERVLDCAQASRVDEIKRACQM